MDAEDTHAEFDVRITRDEKAFSLSRDRVAPRTGTSDPASAVLTF